MVINLAPADLRKEGPSFDLPIALALLVASGQLARPQLEGLWCAAELGLDGSLRPCRGVIALAAKAQQHKAQALVVPPENAKEVAAVLKQPSPTQAAASWCTPAQIERARQRMQRRNPGGDSNGRLSAAALRRTGAIEAAALELWES